MAKKICGYCGEVIQDVDRVIGVTSFHPLKDEDGDLLLDKLKSPDKLYHPKCYKEMTSTE